MVMCWIKLNNVNIPKYIFLLLLFCHAPSVITSWNTYLVLLIPQEADTDENQGTLTFEEFSVFYKMMSLRRDLYLLLLSYSDKKDHLTVEELSQFLKVEQKVSK